MKINTAATAATIFLLTTPITAKIGGSKTSKTSRDGGKSGKMNLRSAALSVLLDADAAPIADTDSFSIARTEAPTAAALSNSNLSDAAPLAEGFVNVAAMGSSKSGKSESPTSKPSLSPSISHQPSDKPSLSPSVSSQPSSEPTSGSKASKATQRSAALSDLLDADAPIAEGFVNVAAMGSSKSGKSESPTSKPSLSPSVSHQPSDKPSLSPSVSSQPSSEPTSGSKASKATQRSAALSDLLDADAPIAEGFVNVAAMGSSKSGKSESPTSKPSLSPSVSHQPSDKPSLTPSVSSQPSAPSKASKATQRSAALSDLLDADAPVTEGFVNVAAMGSSKSGKSESPTSKPSLSPSVSHQPSDKPSLSPTVSTQPSSKPSLSPTVSHQPSDKPSLSPSVSSQPSSEPTSGSKSSKATQRSAALSDLLDADAPVTEGFVNVAAMGSSKSGKSESPTSKPSLSPSVSSQPTSAPSLSPSVSSQPTSAPSLSPSVSPSSEPTSGSKSSKSSRRY